MPRLVAACLLGIACFSLETPAQALTPLRAAGNKATIELSPLLVAADKIYPGEISVINGGIPAIMSGMVDVATNAETQLLRQSVDDPDLRVIFTVAESFYRIVARKSAGIRRIADLKGKRITTPRNTSAHYFLVKMLATVHLSETDVTLVNVNPVTEMSAALKEGRVDAVADVGAGSGTGHRRGGHGRDRIPGPPRLPGTFQPQHVGQDFSRSG